MALPGTITQRLRRCAYRGCRCHADPPQLHGPDWQWTCRCHADPPQLHGPDWQWSRKVDGRTVTRQLSAERAERFQGWAATASTVPP